MRGSKIHSAERGLQAATRTHKHYTSSIAFLDQETGLEWPQTLKRVRNGHKRSYCEGVSNTITQLRFLGCVFLEYHLGIMAKFVLPNISDISGDRKTKLK